MMGEEGRGGNQEYQEKPSDSQFENQYQISLEIKIGHFTMIEPLPSKIAWSKWNSQALTIWVTDLRWSLIVVTRPQVSCKYILMVLF